MHQDKWREILSSSYKKPLTLLQDLGLDYNNFDLDLDPDFKVFVPLRWLSLMDSDYNDPLLLQVISRLEEKKIYLGDSFDPLSESKYQLSECVLQKYQHRILIIASGACPIHCRYCFRRHFSYNENILTDATWLKIADLIKDNIDIYEVILSGGDPLMLADDRLEMILSDLYNIPHVRRIRFHTRFPSCVPERFSNNLWRILEKYSSKIIWVWHINHPNELGDDMAEIAKHCLFFGMRVMSQSVLLKNINDNVDVLENFAWLLDKHHIQPYYIHQLDTVSGARHFEVDINYGLNLMKELRARLPGYLMFKYVKENSGDVSKTPLL